MKINFKLRPVDQVALFGREPEQSIHWFGLTDADLWIEFGDTTFYEYTPEAIAHFEGKPTPYNDYQLSRFIEDFTGLFDQLKESLPDERFAQTSNLRKFLEDEQKWLTLKDDDEDTSYWDEHYKRGSWVQQRQLNSMHLIGGPALFFFRNKDIIRIIWFAEHQLENGTNLWTAGEGYYDMKYSDFVESFKDFVLRFLDEMSSQVNDALEKNWGQVKLNKHGLIMEHEDRKAELLQSLFDLEKEPDEKSNWDEIQLLIDRMNHDLHIS